MLTRNKLLDRLPLKDRTRFLAKCKRVDLALSDVINEPGSAIKHVYFPTTSFISLIASVGFETGVEVSLAGHEGFLGLPIVMGIRTSPSQALVRGAGTAWRMGVGPFRRELEKLPGLRLILRRYSYVVMSQFMNSAGCNRFHKVERRLARWLLMTADRARSETFPVTHEFLARMLGVRREGITESAVALQKRGLISYSRGIVSVVNHRALERSACGCYRSDRIIYDTVFGSKRQPGSGAAKP